MSDIRKLEPGEVWKYFHEITQIPRPSKKEKKIIEYMKNFGLKNNLETIVDKVGNVIIRKPATKGMENRMGVIQHDAVGPKSPDDLLKALDLLQDVRLAPWTEARHLPLI